MMSSHISPVGRTGPFMGIVVHIDGIGLPASYGGSAVLQRWSRIGMALGQGLLPSAQNL